MKTKNILLPTIALLAGTLLSAPAYAQLYSDYHDTVEAIRQDINIERPTLNTVQKSYLDVVQLFNQMNEDLPIDYEKLLAAATSSIKDNQISNKDQYDLMVFAIQTNHNEVLKTLLKAGFNVNVDIELGEAGIEVTPLKNVAIKSKNKEALNFLNIYTLRVRVEKLPKIKPMPQGEHMQKLDKHALIKMTDLKDIEIERKIDSIKNQNK